jgi:hypothetical protein
LATRSTTSEPAPLVNRVAPSWKLLDPLGREVFSETAMGYASYQYAYYDYATGQWWVTPTFYGYDKEPAAFTSTGIYTLVLEGANSTTARPATVAFNIVKVPEQPTVVLDSLIVKSAPDLTVNSVALSPANGLHTGDRLNVSWVIENRGLTPTTGNWNDRIIIRNLNTGLIVANVTVSYDAAAPGNGAIAIGEARIRNTTIQLPEGASAAGRLSFTVLTDADNVIKESNLTSTAESNNAMVAEVDVALSAYVDLVIEGVTLTPASDFQPGQSVAAHWTTANRGNKIADVAWNERLELRNLSTNELVAGVLAQDALIDGALAVNGTRQRSAQFTWPGGVSASGRFSLKIIADSNNNYVEVNSSGTGESNNTVEKISLVGPDMKVKNLRVDTANITAGGLVTLRWEDWNDGSSSTGSAFDDRIVVKNVNANLVLLDTSINYNPLALTGNVLNGAILPGTSRQRSFSFRLPEGLKGAGDMSITVTADQNSAGLSTLYETNLTNDAESNNGASVATTSAAKSYSDLAVDNVTAPANGVGEEAVQVSWRVSNHGQVDTTDSWNDEIIFSRDAIIGNSDDSVIGAVRHTGKLQTTESYSQTVTVNAPTRTAGRYYLGVRSDRAAETLEPDTRADNNSQASAIDLVAPYADLSVARVTAPENALSGENILVTWEVNNNGNAKTDLALWNDRVVLSRDTSPSADDIILSGSVTHTGQIGAGQGYLGKAILTLPRDLTGDYYVIVDTNTNRSMSENGNLANNVGVSAAKLSIDLAPVADLSMSDVNGPLALKPGEAAMVTYTVSNVGNAAASGSWRDRIYLDTGAGGLQELTNTFNQSTLQAGASETRQVTFTLPAGFAEGDFHWVVKTDTDNLIFERNAEANNTAGSDATVHVARTDLAVTQVTGSALVQSGSTLHVEWTVNNNGSAALGNWVDRVFLSKNGTLTKVGEVAKNGSLATNETYTASADFLIPLDLNGEYQVVVITDATQVFDDRVQNNNRSSINTTINLAPYADLTVTQITAPTRVIDDPAPLDISWTVANQGAGAGITATWQDRIVLSQDDTLGNQDDVVVGNYLHEGGLAVGESYSRTERILMAPGATGSYKLFVVADVQSKVFENFSESNNVGKATHNIEVMPIPYADLQVESVTAQGAAASGKPLKVSWDVVNNGIGITNTETWSDRVWLSRNADGSDVAANLGAANHIGALAVGGRYTRSINVTLPEGIAGNYYVNVSASGPFEFTFNTNNTGRSVAIPVLLSNSPDLAVESITLPAAANEGALIDVTWTVVNQGEAAATGLWDDTLLLVPVSGNGGAITLGSFTYDRGLASGIRYTRAEQMRLPAKIEGLYRIKVISNVNLGKSGNQVYEYGVARENNAADTITVSLNDRPDLRVTSIIALGHVTAGTAAGIRYTITNQGPLATTGRWTDKVYL